MIKHDIGELTQGRHVDVVHFGTQEKKKEKFLHQKICLLTTELRRILLVLTSIFFLKQLHKPRWKMRGCLNKQLLHVIIVKYLPSFPQLWSPGPYPCLSSGAVGTWFIVALQRHANYTVHKALYQKSKDRHSGDTKLHLWTNPNNGS